MGFMKDVRNLQKTGKEMTPPEHRGVVGGFRAMKDGVAQANVMLGDVAEQQQKAQMLMATGVVGQATIDSVTDTGVTSHFSPNDVSIRRPSRWPLAQYRCTLLGVRERPASA